MDFQNRSNGKFETKSLLADSMSKPDDMAKSSPSIADSPHKNPDTEI